MTRGRIQLAQAEYPIPTILIDHPDLRAVKITGGFGTLRIINTYADHSNNNAIQAAHAYLSIPVLRILSAIL